MQLGGVIYYLPPCVILGRVDIPSIVHALLLQYVPSIYSVEPGLPQGILHPA